MNCPALEILEKRAAACQIKRPPAIRDVTRPVGAKQANHMVPASNPLSAAPMQEVAQTNMGHDPNPPARIVPMDTQGGMAGSRSGFQETHNFPNMLPGAST